MSMNAIADQKKLNAEALLAAAALESGPGAAWAERFRAAAAARFVAEGAPARRDEYWRYTDPARLVTPLARAARSSAAPARSGPFAALDALTLTFVNGRFRADLSDAAALEHVEIAPLSAALAEEHWAADRLGALEAAGQSPVARPFAALNGAAVEDGVLLRVTGGAPRPIHLRYEADGPGAAYVRHLVEIAAEGALSLFESGPGAERFNQVLEVDLAEGAVLNHVRAQVDPETGQALTSLFARVAARASLKTFTLRAAARAETGGEPPIARNEAMIWLEGDRGSAHIAGGVLGRADAHADNTVFLTHDAEDGESRQVFKTVLDDRARGVFQGKILVKEGAQRTDGYQISQSILLSETAEFDAKPELEIYADDVKCSHGSTTGAIDETALFYLRSRGVEPKTAEALLVAAFIEEAIEEIDAAAPGGEAAREAMRSEVARWMAARA